MARPERFELPTSWFVARRSIQLSYGRKGREYYHINCVPPFPQRSAGIGQDLRTITLRTIHGAFQLAAGSDLKPTAQEEANVSAHALAEREGFEPSKGF